MRYTYRIERLYADNGGGRAPSWVSTHGEVSLGEGRGYLWALEDSPGPRLAARLVRSDGRVVGEVHAATEVSVGLVAGSPTPEQLRGAAQRALDRADALEARAARRDR